MEESLCSKGATCDKVNGLTPSLMRRGFPKRRVTMMVKINEISLCKNAGYVGAWIVDGVISIQTNDHFLIYILPLLDLVDQVGKKKLSRFG